MGHISNKVKYPHLLPLLSHEVTVVQVGSDTLKKKAAGSSEMLGNTRIYQASRCHNPEDNNVIGRI
jgi:hypothetical protein